MRVIYTIGIKIYYLLVLFASFFNKKAKKWINGRKKTKKILLEKPSDKKFYWFHCASLGEFEQARPLIEKLKKEYQKNILVTFFSPSGYEVRKNYPYADKVLYLPIDTISNARRFINRFPVEKAFFVKYEFWFNFLNILHKQNIPVYLISGIFRPNQLFFKPYGKWFKKQLNAFTVFFVQNNLSGKILKSNGFNNVVIAGDTRFDTVWENKLRATHNPLIAQFKGNSKILIAGSCWEPEEDILIESINNKLLPNGWKVIFVPHDVSKNHIERIKAKLKLPPSIYSENEITNNAVLIIDTIGELSNAYQYGDIAFIGGGFRNALHNILEPAAFGLPVLFGPKHDKYPEASLMMKEGSAREVSSTGDFLNVIETLDKNLLFEKLKNAQFIERRKGVVEKILGCINV